MATNETSDAALNSGVASTSPVAELDRSGTGSGVRTGGGHTTDPDGGRGGSTARRAGGGGTSGLTEQTHGLNGVARPTAGTNVVLASADQPSTTLVVQSGKIYDGGGKLIKEITQANIDDKISDVVIQNYKVRGGIGIYLRGDPRQGSEL